jgi:hypothetical protein
MPNGQERPPPQATAIDFIATSARLRFGHSLDSELMVNRGCVSRDKVSEHPRCLVTTRLDMRLSNNTAESRLRLEFRDT